MKTENTPNEFTKQPFEYYENLRDSVLHAATHWKTDRLWSNHLEQINIICLKLQEANKKEILGDRKIVELEHDKTVLKAELKAKDEMLEKMAEGLRWYKGNFDGKDGTKWNGDLFFIEDKFGNTYSDQGENAKELLTQYKQGK